MLRTVDGSTRRLDIDTNWSGETAKGDKTARVGSATTCRRLIPDAVEVCRGECPAEGGSIQWVGRNVTTTVTYDGSSTANWESSNGR